MKKKANVKASWVARLSVFFYERARFSAMLWASLFLFGLFSYTTFMQRQGFPQVDVPVSVVQGVYFVDDKNQVDKDVTQPILDSIADLEQIKSTTANSDENQITIIVEYNEGVTSQEGSNAIEEQVKSIQSSLPNEAEIEYQAIDATRFNSTYDILLSVSSDDKSLDELLTKAEFASNELQSQLKEATVIEVVQPFEEGVNPATGETAKRQTSFDWYGERSESGDFNVNKSVVIGIGLTNDEDIIAFDNKLNDVITDINNTEQFADSELNTAASFAPSIREQISSLQGNLFAGLAIVIIICMIFIGWRAGVLAAVGLTVTLATAVGILYVLGISLNTISLFALVLCLGLIVDDTIIIVEAIDAQNDNAKNLKEAVRGSVDKIALASAAGTFTTVLGFAPLLFISGILGEFIRLLPVTIIIVLIVSLIMSLLFIPVLSRVFLRKDKQNERGIFAKVRAFETWLSGTLSGFIKGANTTRKKATRSLIAVFISLIFIVGTGPLFQQLKFDIFPTAKDSNDVRVEMTFALQATIEDAQATTSRANQQIQDVLGDNLKAISYVGAANQRQAIANISLIPYQERDITSNELVEDLEESITLEDTRVVVNQVGAGPPNEQFPFKAQIDADNPEQANAVAQKLVEFLKNKEIERPNGTTSKIDEVKYTGEQVSITRVDGERIIEVAANFTDDDVSALVQSTQTIIEDEFISDSNNLAGLNQDDISFDFGAETDNQESFESVLFAFPILVLTMYILLAIQFRSFFQPLLILVAVPFSFFGVALALLLTNNPLSFFVMVAFFALVGISVNNGILLTDYANQNRRSGMSPRYAVAEALKARTRPLITTSITSVLALTPLALSDPFWESLAFTLIGGLTASAVLVLVAFPYYYLGLEAIRSRAKVKWQNRKS